VEWKNHAKPDEAAEYELYDYQSDHNEMQNHAATHPKVVEQLKAILAKHPKPVSRSRRMPGKKKEFG
jgi:iduronate 2-sulfatase